ncbi:septum site-determining protein MinD, partial [Klebsiella pneumoniae]
SDRILGLLGSKTRRAEQSLDPVKEHLLITRYNPSRVTSGDMLTLDDIREILSIDLLGLIPESEAVLRASNQGVPVTHD